MNTPTTLQSVGTALLRRWFVQYNPLFTASALCVMGGVYVLSQALDGQADVSLTLVFETYQALVLGAAALLYRRLYQRRSAVFLGLIQVVLMADPTLQTAALATGGHTWTSAVWVVLFGVKFRVLLWAFRMRPNTAAMLLPVAAAAMVAVVPHLAVARAALAMLALLGGGVWGLGMAAICWPPKVASEVAFTGFAEVVFARTRVGLGWAWSAAGFYHLANTVVSLGTERVSLVAAACSATMLVLCANARTERQLWFRLGLALYGSMVVGPPHNTARLWLAVALCAAAASLLVAARNRAPRILVAATLCVWAAGMIAVDGWQAPLGMGMALGMVATVPLGALAFRQRAWSALGALAVIHLPALQAGPWMDLSPNATQRGLGLLALGFLLLPLGVVVHGWLAASALPAQAPATDQTQDPEAAVPLTSAAVSAEYSG